MTDENSGDSADESMTLDEMLMANQAESGNSISVPSQAELDASAGNFMGKDGYKVLPPPTPDEYAALITQQAWKSRRVAHRFDDGWYDGTFKGRHGGRTQYKDWYDVYYHVDRKVSCHVLSLGTYGETRLWVILKDHDV